MMITDKDGYVYGMGMVYGIVYGLLSYWSSLWVLWVLWVLYK